MESVPYSFCCACGTPYGNTEWPRTCTQCGYVVYKNAVSVGVGIVPVHRKGVFIGVLVGRRDIEPQKGWLCLPCGYQDIESWQECIAREIREETGVVVDPAKIIHYTTETRPDGQQNLIVGVTEPVEEEEVLKFEPNSECSGIDILSAPTTLAFPIHTKVLTEYLLYGA